MFLKQASHQWYIVTYGFLDDGRWSHKGQCESFCVITIYANDVPSVYDKGITLMEIKAWLSIC